MKRLVDIHYTPVFLPTDRGMLMGANIDMKIGETVGSYTAERVSFILSAVDLKNLFEAICEAIRMDLEDLSGPMTAAYTKALADSGRDEESDDTDDDSLAVENCNS